MSDPGEAQHIDLSAPITLSPDVLMRPLNNETVLLDLRTERYLGFDPVGTRIWQLMAQGGTPASAIGPMLDEYDIDETTLRADITAFVLQLMQRGLASFEP